MRLGLEQSPGARRLLALPAAALRARRGVKFSCTIRDSVVADRIWGTGGSGMGLW